MRIEGLKAFLEPLMQRVRDMMEAVLASDISLLGETNSSLLASGGKGMRPGMALLIAGALGGATKDSIRFAAAAELLHNATLLHDDVVDGADERRGAPTVSSLLGGTASVLIGDFWLVKAVECILSADRESARAVRIFSKTLSDLTEGELLQMEKASTGDTTREDYTRIIYSKTASLFEATALTAALSTGAPEPVIAAMGRFGREIGMAFQIRDDMFDYMDAPGIGKPVGIDLTEGKITEPLLSALDAAPSEESRIRGLVRRIPAEPSLADEVRAFVRDHDGLSGAAAALDGYVKKALDCLDVLPSSEEKSYLRTLSCYVGERIG